MVTRPLETSLYHSGLRVAALTSALTLLFVSGMLHPITQELTVVTEQYVATAVNATAGVEPNEYNQITAALTEQQAELDERSNALRERELALGLSTGANSNGFNADTVTLVNSIILFIILVLLLVNYTLDWRFRQHQTAASIAQ